MIGRDARGRVQRSQEGTARLDLRVRHAQPAGGPGRRRGPTDRVRARRRRPHDAAHEPGGRDYGFGYDARRQPRHDQMPGGGEHTLAFDAVDRLERFTPAGSTAFHPSTGSGRRRWRRSRFRAGARSTTSATPAAGRRARPTRATRRASPTRGTRTGRSRSTGRRPAAARASSSPTPGTRTCPRASRRPASRKGVTTTPTTPTCGCRA